MRIETVNVSGFKGAIIGSRLPMCKNYEEAEQKSDSTFYLDGSPQVIGTEDLRILKNLIKADKNGEVGQPNSKYLRMIHVQCSVEAPLYWWKEASTYKVGTTVNSTSTMHKLAVYPITEDCFEMDDFDTLSDFFMTIRDKSVAYNVYWQYHSIPILEQLRQKYNETKDKRYWKELIRLLPDSWLQTRMFDLDYATLRNIYYWRKNHKLTEWHTFCRWIETLPYAKELICDIEGA